MGLFFEIMIAALAVFGLWCLLRLGAEACFCSSRISVSLVLEQEEDVDAISDLLSQARSLLSCRRKTTITVVCTRQLLQSCGRAAYLRCVCERYGARLILKEEDSEP